MGILSAKKVFLDADNIQKLKILFPVAHHTFLLNTVWY